MWIKYTAPFMARGATDVPFSVSRGIIIKKLICHAACHRPYAITCMRFGVVAPVAQTFFRKQKNKLQDFTDSSHFTHTRVSMCIAGPLLRFWRENRSKLPRVCVSTRTMSFTVTRLLMLCGTAVVYDRFGVHNVNKNTGEIFGVWFSTFPKESATI